MPAYHILLRDHSTELIDGADAYQQEGQMTTFFRMAPGRQVIDSWSTRVASFRTAEVVAIRRFESVAADAAATCNRARRGLVADQAIAQPVGTG